MYKMGDKTQCGTNDNETKETTRISSTRLVREQTKKNEKKIHVILNSE